MQRAGTYWMRACGERYFFLHIPKTAGISLRTYIDAQFHPDDTFPFDRISYVENATPPVRRDYHYYEGHFTYDLMRQIIGTDPVTMTMLRDPMEQVLSQYSVMPLGVRYRRIVLLGEEVDLERPLSMPIDAYFAQQTDKISTVFQNVQTKHIASKSEFVCASLMAEKFEITLPPCNARDLGPDLRQAIQRLNRFAFVGLTERFRESLALLAYTFGWGPIREMPVRNVTEKRIRQDQLADQTIARITELNEMDIALYAHAQELFDERYRAMITDLTRRFGGGATHKEEELDELLEMYYAERFAETYPLEPQIHIDFTRPLNTSGWHSIEQTRGHGLVRWTGLSTTASIDVPIAPDRDLQISFHALAALAPDILESVTLYVNDLAVPLGRERAPAGGAVFSAIVPREALANGKPFARLSIRTDRTVRPMDLDPTSTDDRALGVPINWINLEPAPGRMSGEVGMRKTDREASTGEPSLPQMNGHHSNPKQEALEAIRVGLELEDLRAQYASLETAYLDLERGYRDAGKQLANAHIGYRDLGAYARKLETDRVEALAIWQETTAYAGMLEGHIHGLERAHSRTAGYIRTLEGQLAATNDEQQQVAGYIQTLESALAIHKAEQDRTTGYLRIVESELAAHKAEHERAAEYASTV